MDTITFNMNSELDLQRLIQEQYKVEPEEDSKEVQVAEPTATPSTTDNNSVSTEIIDNLVGKTTNSNPPASTENDNDDDDGGDIIEPDTPASSDDSKQDSSDSDEVNLLDIIRQEGLLVIPDDFDEELTEQHLDYFKEQTFLIRDAEIINSRRSVFQSDPYKLAVFDYFMTADTDADLPNYTQTLNNIRKFENYDVSDEDSQRQVLEMWLKEGLDPNNTAHKLRLSRISSEIDEMINEGKGEENAKLAVDYFNSKYQDEKKKEEKRVQDLSLLKQQQERERERLETQWHQGFQQAITNGKLTEDKKRSLLAEQYTVVSDGENEIPVWLAKEALIKRDPNLYVVYLQWLNENFDLETGKFKTSKSENPNQAAERKIIQLAQKKASTNKNQFKNSNIPKDTGSYEHAKVDALRNI